jgi:glutamine amidotransferase
MCRLFGFRSVIESQVHHSLIHAENALMRQSERHPDGWGVVYYVAGAPHIIKSAASAIHDHLFRRVSGIVSSETVLAHIRKATQGEMTIINTHPFQYGSWVFAHNGNIAHFGERREGLRKLIAPRLRRFILGDTDSEIFFYLILTHLARRTELHRPGCDINDLAEAASEAIHEITAITGGFHLDTHGSPDETYLTFLLTNGSTMLAHQGGKELYYSTYKTQCSQRHLCASYAEECENKSKTGFVNHLIFCSEPLHGENIWFKMRPGQMIGVDWRMKLHNYTHHCVDAPDSTEEMISLPLERRLSDLHA